VIGRVGRVNSHTSAQWKLPLPRKGRWRSVALAMDCYLERRTIGVGSRDSAPCSSGFGGQMERGQLRTSLVRRRVWDVLGNLESAAIASGDPCLLFPSRVSFSVQAAVTAPLGLATPSLGAQWPRSISQGVIET